MSGPSSSDPDSVPHLTSNSTTSTYVRQAKPSEIPVIAAIFERAFARDPVANWLGRAPTVVPHYTAQDKRSRRTLSALHSFELLLIKMTQILGLVVVVVERDGADEKVVGGALWMPPGKNVHSSPFTLLRISPWRVLWRWGLVGVKRAMIDYGPSVEKSLDEVFGARGLKWLDSWYLLMIAIDPEYEGKGYCSLLMRDGWNRASGKPVHLEASTPHSRDIYAHLGFEFNKEHRFGVGSVNEMGVKAKGAAAVGVPVFVMTKWETAMI